MIKKKIFFSISCFFFYLLPVSLIFSIFFSNLIVVTISIYGIYEIYKNKINLFKYKYFNIFLTFWIFICLNSLFSENLIFSIRSSFFFIRYIFFIFGIYFLYKYNNKILLNFSKIILVIFFILLIDSLIEFNTQKNTFNLIYNFIFNTDFNNLHQTGRVSSFFFKELILGSYVSKFTILIICIFHIFYNFQNKKIILILATSIIITLISGDRAPIVSLILFSFGYIFFFLKIKFKNKFIILASFTLFISILVFNIPSLKNRIINHSIDDFKNSKNIFFSDGHKAHAITALNMFVDKPTTGHGSNNFRNVCQNYRTQENGCNTHPHNIIAQFASELGLIGILFLIYFYFTILKKTISGLIKFKDMRQKNISLIYFSLLVYYFPLIPSANFYNSWVNNIFSILFILFLIKNKFSKNHL